MKSMNLSRVVLLALGTAAGASIVATHAAATPVAVPGAMASAGAAPQTIRPSQPVPLNIGVIGTGTLGIGRPVGVASPRAAPGLSKPINSVATRQGR